MKKYIFSILIISLFGIFGGICFVEAGFGITPPYIKNDRLVPGSHIEETIYLVRGDPDQDAIAEITSIDAPNFKDWIIIEKGLKIPLLKGIQQIPMKVIIDVPKDAPFGDYEGFIYLRAVPAGSQEGQIAALLGGRIDISLVVSEKGVTDFRIKGASVPNFEKGSPLVFFMMLENTGNTKTKPSKVHIDIYDLNHIKILTSGDITEMNEVAPFETKQIEGQIALDLEIGEYWADITPYKKEESLETFKILFTVLPEGTLKKEKPLVNKKQGLKDLFYISIVIILLVIIIIITRFYKDKLKLTPKNKGNKKNLTKK